MMQQVKDKSINNSPVKNGQKKPFVESYIFGVILLFITLAILLIVKLIPKANPNSYP